MLEFLGAGMLEAEDLAALRVDTDMTCLMAPSFRRRPWPERSKEPNNGCPRKATLDGAQFGHMFRQNLLVFFLRAV